MVWEQLSINSIHWVYLLLGAYTSIFMLVSSFIKEKLYIGEATIATIMGIILGPHAADLIDPSTWGNVDLITLEFTRIILVVQCFAVGVELPKRYMEKHWRSIFYMLVPVMTWGWLSTSLFIWWMMPRLNWLESLAISATVTATDPILASSVVGKGKFAQRVPKHIRDIISAESGCNDGAAFPFIYLSIYMIRYFGHSNEVAQHWFTLSILYEIVLGSIYGVAVGYIARRAIRYAHDHDLVDRESFLVFYFVLALFCAGSGSMLGLDDLLVGFAAGVGFSNDGWFVTKTEEAHVSNVIDLLLNLSFFLYFGTIIPWNQFNSEMLGTTPWRLVVIAIFALLFRRIPPVLALKPFIPDIRTWREALFAGHFGPIGVGAIFAAILARAEFETESTTPLAVLPGPDFENYWLVELIWPVVCFLVISSIIVHGSSVAVFTLGKRINTLTMTMSYTKDKDDPSWMSRLPRIASTSKSQGRNSMSKSRDDLDSTDVPPGQLPPIGMAGQFLKRRKESDDPRHGPGGPISQSAISPQRRESRFGHSDSETLNEKESIASQEGGRKGGDVDDVDNREDVNVYEEGNEIITENRDGDVVDERDLESGEGSPVSPQSTDQAIPKEDVTHGPWHRKLLNRWKNHRASAKAEEPEERRSGPAMVYHYGNTVIIEDEHGEVIKKYDLPQPTRPGMDRKASWIPNPENHESLRKMANWVGYHHKRAEGAEGAEPAAGSDETPPHHDDPALRFTHQGRRMNANDFIKQIQQMDPKARIALVENAPADIQHNVRAATELATNNEKGHAVSKVQELQAAQAGEEHGVPSQVVDGDQTNELEKTTTAQSDASLQSIVPDSKVSDYISHKMTSSVKSPTAAERRRNQAASAANEDEADSDDDGTERRPPISTRETLRSETGKAAADRRRRAAQNPDEETEPERKRREAALGISRNNTQQTVVAPGSSSGNPSPRSLQWSHDVGKERQK